MNWGFISSGFQRAILNAYIARNTKMRDTP